MCREKTRQGAPDVASHSLSKVEAYLTVREILPETSKGADGVAWRELSGFGRQQVCNVRVYTKEALVGKQIVGVVNFPPKQIGPTRSEFLVTGFVQDGGGVVLAVPDMDVPNGLKLA